MGKKGYADESASSSVSSVSSSSDALAAGLEGGRSNAESLDGAEPGRMLVCAGEGTHR